MSAVPLAQVPKAQAPTPAKARQRKLTGMVKTFLELFTGNPSLTVTEAARQAGYAHPQADGWKLQRKWTQEIEESRERGRKTLKMSAEEAEQVVVDIARNPEHRDRLKAAETMLKMHGKLNDKLQVTVDRPMLNKELDALLEQLKTARALETGVIASTQHAEKLETPSKES